MNIQIIEDGIHITISDRCYILKNIQYGAYQLKSNIKTFLINDPKDRHHIDIVNLYSSTARRSFIRECATLFNKEIKIAEKDLNQIINILEEKREDFKKSNTGPVTKLELMTTREREEALELLSSPALLDEIIRDLTMLGYVGENINKLTAYLAVSSRKLDDPLSIMITSRSAAGKSSLQDSILSLLPPEDFIKFTALTGKSLFYQDEFALQNRVLAIEEEAGSREASYSLRAIQSSKNLSIATTGRDSATGKLKSEIYKVRGPVCIFFTTSNIEMDQETANRFLRLTIDESREQTKQILKRQRESETLEGLFLKEKIEKIIRKHQNAQRLLYPIKVINPYANELTFNEETLRARRDHKKYLTLIKSIAFLKQHQRKHKAITIKGKEIPYIEVIPDDIKKANELAKQIFTQTLEDLSPPSQTLLGLIEKMVKESINGNNTKAEEVVFTRRQVRDFTFWSNHQIKDHIKELQDLEYLVPISGGPRKKYYYQLSNSSENNHPTINLIDALKICKKTRNKGESGPGPDFSSENN